MLKKILLSASVLLCTYVCNAQRAEIVVDHFTGSANVNIPLLNVQSGACALPLNLIYSTNGVRITDVGFNTGRNWRLTTGGEIRRDLKGLPDDCKKDRFGRARLGWLYNTKGATINNFTVSNDNNSATCTDETADINYITTNFSDLADTEPDIFYVNVPGLSCKLVFDNNHVIKTIPFKDLKVTYATDTSGAIKSFNITTDNGISYLFADIEKATKTTRGLSTVSYFKNEFNQYSKGIDYNSAWALSKISDANNNVIGLNYAYIDDLPEFTNEPVTTSFDTVSVFVGGPSNTSIKVDQFTRLIQRIPKKILSITYGQGIPTYTGITFANRALTGYGSPVVADITGYGKEIDLDYASSPLLKSLSIKGIDGTQVFNFKYNNSIADTIRMIPDSSTIQMDYWGYFNKTITTPLKPQVYINPASASYERYRVLSPGNVSASYPYQLAGSNRNADVVYSLNAALEEITEPEGAIKTIKYEPNDFYDSTAGIVIKGGGIRVKQVTTYDGINSANNIVQNFSYLNPSTGLSSGKPISLPVFAFTIPYTGTGTTQDLWNYSTARTETNLSEEDNAIIYSHVKESSTNAGSALYEFTNPATNWDLTAGTDWAPTIVNIARPTCTSYGFIKNDINTYPFPPNINYEFERGLLKKSTSFNDAGTKVSETTYSYQRSSAPVVINGFKWEDNGSVKAYAKYKIYTSSSELTTQTVNKVFDSGTLTTSLQTTTNLYYASLQHKLPTKTETLNSDGSISRVNTSYVKDFNTSSVLDSSAVAISNLKALNVNIPIEKYYTVERNSVSKTIGADLIKFKAFNPSGLANLYLPARRLKFIAADGVSNFVPASITSGAFVNDSRYIVKENDLIYNDSGILQSKDDNNKNVQTVLSDVTSMMPVASITNANADEVCYNDFENRRFKYAFTKDNNTYTYSLNARTGGNSLSLEASAGLSRTVKKNSRADNYIFSIWANSSATGNLTITLTNTSSQVSTYNLALSNSAGKWKYYEVKVPLTNMTASFVVKFQSSIAVLVDDVLFYPENSEVNTIGYDPVSFVKTSETNTNGVSNYYTYDGFDRLRFAYDQDRQIVLKKTYIREANISPSVNLTYSNVPPSMYATFTANFLDYNSTDGMTFTWDFGDGSPIQVTSTKTTSHTYAVTGSYTVKVTVNSPFYNQVESSVTIAVSGVFTVNYTKIGTQGVVSNLQFYQGGVLKYNFSTTDLVSGQQVLQGIYDVKIYFTRGAGTTCKSIGWNTDVNGGSCFPSTAASPITFTSDMRTTNTLMVVVDTATCLQ